MSVAWERRLGASGPPVTAIGLGLAALGRPGYLTLGHGRHLGADRGVAALERRAHEVLDAAYEAGVRYFDAARSYGRAEAFLASWLAARGLAPGAVTVGSKWGYTYTAGWRVDADPPEVKDLSAGAFRRQVAETRELLGDHLSLYQIHSATVESGVLEDAEVLTGLAELRDGGVAVGLSVTGPGQAATIERAVSTGAFDSVQATWNLLERSAADALATAHAAGMGVIVKEAVANGRLTAGGDQPSFAHVADELGVTPDALAVAAALAQPWTGVVLSGAVSPAQLRSNLAARDIAWTAELDARLEPLAVAPERYWAERAAMSWT
ncbi:MAG TPA: aldo/keto reductase [Solirubrobacteraceae bacterium]|nr:aldo/keto reductase [Solirubrobacteraceae bacterium]